MPCKSHGPRNNPGILHFMKGTGEPKKLKSFSSVKLSNEDFMQGFYAYTYVVFFFFFIFFFFKNSLFFFFCFFLFLKK